MKPRHVSFLVAMILPLFTACDLADPEEGQADVTTTTGALDYHLEDISLGRAAAKDAPEIVTVGGQCDCTKTDIDGGTQSASSCCAGAHYLTR